MSRKKPSDNTIKKLFALSGNQCAFPDCEARLVNHQGDLIGQICHIEAAEPGGQRYNSNQDDEERRSFANLVLMCANHHKITDNVQEYTVEKLIQIKKDHESKFLDSPFQPKQKTLTQAKNSLKYSAKTQYFSDSGTINVYNGLSINEVTQLFNKFSNTISTNQPSKPYPKKDYKPNLINNSISQFTDNSNLNQTETQTQIETPSSNFFSVNQIDFLLDQVRNGKSKHKIQELIAIEKAGISMFEQQKALFFYEIGKAYNQLMLYHKARENLENAVKIDPHNLTLTNQLAELLIESDEIKQAKLLLTHSDVDSKNHAEIVEKYRLLGFISKIEGRYDESLVCFQQAVSNLQIDQPDSKPVLSNLLRLIAFIYTITGNNYEAEKFYIQAGLALNPHFNLQTPLIDSENYISLNNNISIFYALHGKFDQAELFLKTTYYSNFFQLVIEKDVYSYVALILNLAITSFYLNKYEESEKYTIEADKFISQNLPHSFSLRGIVHTCYANLHLIQNQKLEAEKEYSQAYNFLGRRNDSGTKIKTAAINCHQANAYARLGYFDEAVELYRNALNQLRRVFVRGNSNIARIENKILNFSSGSDIILAF
ncbi:MAG: hypothetical protein OHK0017_13400 [Patescibacteria group bacterium]